METTGSDLGTGLVEGVINAHNGSTGTATTQCDIVIDPIPKRSGIKICPKDELEEDHAEGKDVGLEGVVWGLDSSEDLWGHVAQCTHWCP